MRRARLSSWRTLAPVALAGLAIALATMLLAPSPAASAEVVGQVRLEANAPQFSTVQFPGFLSENDTYELVVTGTATFQPGVVSGALHDGTRAAPGGGHVWMSMGRPGRAGTPGIQTIGYSLHDFDQLGPSRGGRAKVLEEDLRYNSFNSYRVRFTNLRSQTNIVPSLWFTIPKTYNGRVEGQPPFSGGFTVTIRRVARGGIEDLITKRVGGRIAFNSDKVTVGSRSRRNTANNKAPQGWVPIRARTLGTIQAAGFLRVRRPKPWLATIGPKSGARGTEFHGRGFVDVTVRRRRVSKFRVSFVVISPNPKNRAQFAQFVKKNPTLDSRFTGSLVVRIRVTRTNVPWECKRGTRGFLRLADQVTGNRRIDFVRFDVCGLTVVTQANGPGAKLAGRDQVRVFATGLTAGLKLPR